MAHKCQKHFSDNIGGLVQERRNSIANALELRLSCTNQSIWNKLSSWHDSMSYPLNSVSREVTDPVRPCLVDEIPQSHHLIS